MDYKDTVFLPQTSFPMRGQLPKQEPEILAYWEQIDLYNKQRKAAAGKPKFVLHDGPPYANGHLHIGHALNKILKDFVVRSQQMLGHDAPFVPGWDCHGLPIEWKIEEKYRKGGHNKDDVDILEFRKECREFADHWLNIQREEFKRLGSHGDYANPYTTMNYESEAQIAQEMLTFLMKGSIYKGVKPVMWSVVEKTALAEAEVEYKDHTSTSIYVRFPIQKTAHSALEGAHFVIWTTTPWTIPANRAIAYGDDLAYSLVVVSGVEEGSNHKSFATVGEKLLIATDLIESVCKELGVTSHNVDATFSGADFAGTVCHHPWHKKGYDFDVPLLPADHVTTEAGTGFVHTAPSHGMEDFIVGQKHNLEVPDYVGEDGVYRTHVPLFAGVHVYKAADPVCAALEQVGALLGKGKLTHSYPHSWRSKAPLIYRTTAQWFISLAENSLRDKCLKAIDETEWFPGSGRNRIYSMVENRPDWCISRQRAWGVPIPLFEHKETGELLKDEAVNARIVAAFKEHGADAWYKLPASHFLGDVYNTEDYRMIKDVVDVWFDSGATHTFTLEKRAELTWPANLYLEGSDQHRGWFQASLLEACGTRDKAPYKQVLTHGFVLDEKGYKMSKSMGNVVAPEKVIDTMGADILRLWVAMSDYFEDVRIGDSILKYLQDIYRRYRNTLRYLLGALKDFDASQAVSYDQMPELERWVLNRLHQLDAQARECFKTYKFKDFYMSLHNFCSVDLSAFYFDIRKDALYCDGAQNIKRQSTLTVMHHVFECLSRWLAPMLCFTAEEAYLARYENAKDQGDSIHLQEFVTIPAAWENALVAEKWEKVRTLRGYVTAKLEEARASNLIKSSLQAMVHLTVPESAQHYLEEVALDEVCITSQLELEYADVPGPRVDVRQAGGDKCERCWKVLPEVKEGLCHRCAEVVKNV